MDEQPLLTGSATPQSVDEARRVVEASRQRISATLDELEVRLVEKKQALRRRLDVARPVRGWVRGKPLAGVALAVGAGVLLGVLGSRGDDEAEPELGEAEVDAIRRWRRERRRRLMDVAADELPSFEPPPSRLGRIFRGVAHELAGAAAALAIAAITERLSHAEPPFEQDLREY